jgi:hypothetical protein
MDPEGIPEAGIWSWISKAISRLASKRFASLERAMGLDLEGNSRLALKTFERLKRALKLDLEGTLEAGDSRGWNGLWLWIRKAFSRLASKAHTAASALRQVSADVG